MKNNSIKKVEDQATVKVEGKISRKQALKKTGYIALSAATMMMLLSNPNKAQAASPAAPTAW